MKEFPVFYISKKHKAVKGMASKATIQCNKLIQLENSTIMYSIYNAETLEQLTNIVHQIHNTTTSNDRTAH